MKQTVATSSSSWLLQPVLGTQVIPPDARVDPARFPETEFPLTCPKCDYLLRGLKEERCPECGEPFDRGRLLVLEYAVWRSARQRTYRKVALILIVVCWVLLGLHRGGEYLLDRRVAAMVAGSGIANAGKVAKLMDLRVLIDHAMVVAEVAAVGVAITLIVVTAVRYRRLSEQRRRIVRGIQAGEQSEVRVIDTDGGSGSD